MKTRDRLAVSIGALLAWTSIAFAESPSSGSEWPQWRGPGGRGVSIETGFAAEWSPTKNIKYVYLVSDGGILTCLNVDTGEVVYEGGSVPVPSQIRASLVAFEDKLLVTSDNGTTFVIRAGPKFEVLATNTVEEPVWASPALSRGTIYIRGAEHLFAIAPNSRSLTAGAR